MSQSEPVLIDLGDSDDDEAAAPPADGASSSAVAWRAPADGASSSPAAAAAGLGGAEDDAIDVDLDYVWVWRSGNVWSFVDSEEHGPAEQLSELQALAKAWRGECLSSVGELSNPRLRWRCSRGHEFEASAESVKMQRVWCPRWKCQRGNHPMCAQPLDRKPPPGVLLEMCRASGCRPLNTENHLIQDVDSKLQWVCAHGCRFEQSLLDGEKVPGWCPRCDADRREKLRAAQEIASRRGGQTVEAPADTLRWHRDMGAAVQVCCAQKHTFPLGLKKIIDGDWCPDCPPPDPLPPPPQQQQQPRRRRSSRRRGSRRARASRRRRSRRRARDVHLAGGRRPGPGV